MKNLDGLRHYAKERQEIPSKRDIKRAEKEQRAAMKETHYVCRGCGQSFGRQDLFEFAGALQHAVSKWKACGPVEPEKETP